MFSNSGINKVFLVGYIGKEPFLQASNHQPAMLCFPMVTNEYIKKNGDSIEHVEWHQIRIPEAMIPDAALTKGQMVYVQGKIQTRQFIDEHNIKRYKTEILAHQIQVLATVAPDLSLLPDA